MVGFDQANDNILPFATVFATLITRKRKNVRAEDLTDLTVSVCIFAFDCLLLIMNGDPLIVKTFAQRSAAMNAASRTTRTQRRLPST